jgi:hypothetical protein
MTFSTTQQNNARKSLPHIPLMKSKPALKESQHSEAGEFSPHLSSRDTGRGLSELILVGTTLLLLWSWLGIAIMMWFLSSGHIGRVS